MAHRGCERRPLRPGAQRSRGRRARRWRRDAASCCCCRAARSRWPSPNCPCAAVRASRRPCRSRSKSSWPPTSRPLHFAVGSRAAGAAGTPVAVVSRATLERWLAQCRRGGHRARRRLCRFTGRARRGRRLHAAARRRRCCTCAAPDGLPYVLDAEPLDGALELRARRRRDRRSRDRRARHVLQRHRGVRAPARHDRGPALAHRDAAGQAAARRAAARCSRRRP